MFHRRLLSKTLRALLVLGMSQGGSASAAGSGQDPSITPRQVPVDAFTIVCDTIATCQQQANPGPPDRAVRPFQGSLGRPCGYRWRATPEGTRKVRVCF